VRRRRRIIIYTTILHNFSRPLKQNPHDHYEKKITDDHSITFMSIPQNSHDLTQACAKTNYLHDYSAKFSWPLCIYSHDHYAKYRWAFYKICMTTLQIHTSILQNSHDITQTCAKTETICMTILQNLHDIMHVHMTIMRNTHDYSIKSAWLRKSTGAFCKSTWEQLHNGSILGYNKSFCFVIKFCMFEVFNFLRIMFFFWGGFWCSLSFKVVFLLTWTLL
jgi:hypothetical protein